MLYDKRWDTRSKPETVPEALNLAADIIEKRGLAKGALITPEGKVCFLGAMNLAFTNNPYRLGAGAMLNEEWDLFQASWKHLTAYLMCTKQLPKGSLVGDVVEWNNAMARTQDDVVDACREAAVWNGVTSRS